MQMAQASLSGCDFASGTVPGIGNAGLLSGVPSGTPNSARGSPFHFCTGMQPSVVRGSHFVDYLPDG